MDNRIQVFAYHNQEIEFDLSNNNLMVNATEMAKVFDKNIGNFLRNEDTKNFIAECLNNANSHYLRVSQEEDLIDSKQKSGTWMHRVLALKFAAWLSPAFELWVYRTIDEILFGNYKKMEASLKESADRKNRIDTLRKAMRESEEYRELERLELEEKQASYRRTKDNRNQLDLFRNLN